MNPVMGGGTMSDDTLTLSSSSMRGVEERVRRKDSTWEGRTQRPGSVVNLSNYDPTRNGNPSQTRLFRRRGRTDSSLSL